MSVWDGWRQHFCTGKPNVVQISLLDSALSKEWIWEKETPPPLKQTNKETAAGHRAADGFNWICRFWENLTSSEKNLIWHFQFNTESGNIGRSVYQHWFEVIAMQVSEFNTVFTFQFVVVVFFFCHFHQLHVYKHRKKVTPNVTHKSLGTFSWKKKCL